MARLGDGTAMQRHGPRGAPTVILIHGLGLNREVWQWTLPALSDGYDVITYDLLGHGQSSAPPPAPTLSDFSAQLLRLMDETGIDHAAIVGFSLGGMIARRFAMDHRDRCTALAILHSPHRRTAEAQAAIKARVAQAEGQGPGATVEAALVRWFTDDFRAANPDMMDLVRGWVTANDPNVYPSIYNVLATGVDEITDPAMRLDIPTLVITGDEDYGNGPEMTRATAAGIDGGEALILPGLRHMALAEDPASTNEPLRAFLDRVSGG